MQIHVRTDRHINGDHILTDWVSRMVKGGLGHHLDRLTRVEVHLNDVNGDKGGDDDIRCMIEVRPQGVPAVAVTHHSATVEQAVDGAASRLARVLNRTFSRLHDQQRRHAVPLAALELEPAF